MMNKIFTHSRANIPVSLIQYYNFVSSSRQGNFLLGKHFNSVTHHINASEGNRTNITCDYREHAHFTVLPLCVHIMFIYMPYSLFVVYCYTPLYS